MKVSATNFIFTPFVILCLGISTLSAQETKDDEWIRIGGDSSSAPMDAPAGEDNLDQQQAFINKDRETLDQERLSLAEERRKFEEERVKFAQERLEFEKQRAAFLSQIKLPEGVGALFSVVGGSAGTAASSSSERPLVSRLTRLRVDGKPLGVWRQTAKTKLEEVSAYVWNAGDVTADGVSVVAVLPGGKEVALAGPSTLAPGKKDLFTAKPGLSVTRAGEIQVKPTCSNCWK